jgi:mRNA interferase RelE/StbE
VANYELVIKQSAAKELEEVPRKNRRQIARRITSLAGNPRPHGCEKLSGQEKYRLRHGDYRVLYEIDDTARRATIVKIAHRRDVYRKR